ncbi:MAG: DNA mismatch repair protein MutS [Planctomycetota bacterium]
MSSETQESNPPRRGRPPGTSSGAAPKVTMMGQFEAAKREAGDALVFFRMGDFYELFGEDAKVASRELGIALTSRAKGADALPMAGVPVRTVDSYTLRLVAKGFKVAVCEQIGDPRTTKGIVAREIVRVVTAGTLTEEDALDARASNFLAALHVDGKQAGLAWLDLSTGRAFGAEFPTERIDDELARVGPAELLLDERLADRAPDVANALARDFGPRITHREPWRFSRDGALRTLKAQFGVATLEGFGFTDESVAVPAAGALVEYARDTQRGATGHLLRLERVDTGRHMVLDRATRSTLELTATQRDARREGTLLDAIDQTLTPMGGRLIREWLLSPLRDVDAILYRQRGVAEFVEGPFLREDTRGMLADVLDVERLVGKVSTGRANARDLVALAASLAIVAPLRARLDQAYSKALGELCQALDPMEDLVARVQGTLVDGPPNTLREGGLVREGVNAELDELRSIAKDGKKWMARFQAEAIERYGIPGLKIGFTSVFGYYLEVPRGQLEQVPDSFVRKQTVKNAERYITEELKEFEDKVLRAEETSRDLEHRIFSELRDATAAEVPRILGVARALAEVDVLAGLAETAAKRRYAAPEIDNGERIEITAGRHPVIEATQHDVTFVPNDSLLDRKRRMVGLITGPNMAGKSTYIRQTALIVLLAQIGSFVPAAAAKVGVCDRIATRLGSADDLARGASTFMVEMVEIANILNNATSRSLVLLDEVGRGTSTFDGLALAWAIVEHLHQKVRARTLFATHYHQLTGLSERLDGIYNLNVAVREWDDEIVFLHQIIEGGTDRSYGIQVARLAGVPPEVVARAKEVLRDVEHEAQGLGGRVADRPLGEPQALPKGARSPEAIRSSSGAIQLGLFGADPTPLERRLDNIDLDATSPRDALEVLAELKRLRAES